MSAGVLPEVPADSEGRIASSPSSAGAAAALGHGALLVSWGGPSPWLEAVRGAEEPAGVARATLVPHVVSPGGTFLQPPRAGLILVDARGVEAAALAWLSEAARRLPEAVFIVCVSVGATSAERDARAWIERGCLGVIPAADADPGVAPLLRALVDRMDAYGGSQERLRALRDALATMQEGRFRLASPSDVDGVSACLDELGGADGRNAEAVVEILRGTLELRSRGRGPNRAVDLCFHRTGKEMDLSIASDAGFASSARAGWTLEEARLFQSDALAPWEREHVLQATDRVLEESALETSGGWLEVARFLAGQLGSETVVLGHLDRRGRWHGLAALGAGDLAAQGDAEGPRRANLADVFRPLTREGRPLLCNRPVGRPSFQRPWRRVAGVPILRAGRTIGTLHVANRNTDYGDGDLAKMFLIARRLSPFLTLVWELKSERERRVHGERLLGASGKLAFELDDRGQVVFESSSESADEVPPSRFVTDVPALAPLGLSLVEAAGRARASGHATLWESPAPGGTARVRLAPLPEGHVGAFLELVAQAGDLDTQAQRFFELSLDMLAILEGERLMRVNQAFVETIGWNDGELLGRPIAELLHPDDRGAFLGLLNHLGDAQGRTADGEMRVLTRAGLVRLIEWRASRQHGATYLVGRDVTEERRAVECLAAQHAELARQHRDTVEDHAIARRVLAGVIREGCLDAPFISYSLSPLAVFNGDVALAAELPDGSLRWFLGDFAGHGLSGAIGTIPLASTFHATARKGVSLAETLVTLNDSLRSILPPWLFCAGALLELDQTGTRLSVWNAGLPAVIVRHADGSLVRVGSRHAPLGILEAAEFATSVEQVAVCAGDRVVVFSDGLVEAKRRDGREWGLPAIETLLADAPLAASLTQVLLDGVEQFRAGAPRSDDTSLVEVVVGPGPRLRPHGS